MSLNTIEFSNRTIADLYKNSLVEFEGAIPTTKAKAAPDQWKYLGENKKKVLVIVKYPEAVYVPDKQLSFLTNLLVACKLNLGDTAVLNFQKYSSNDSERLHSYFNPKTVFLFGVEPNDFGLPLIFPHFQVQSFNDATYLFTPVLEEIEHDKVLKTKLWVCLKKIFNL